jgi:anti-sigma factor RsiW
MSDYKDIFGAGQDSQGALSEEQLLAYLEGRMSAEERRRTEELLSAEGMESDALEGLQALSPGETSALKNQLNAGLLQALHKKRRTRRGMSGQRWTWIAILIILMLTILGYAVIYLAKQ